MVTIKALDLTSIAVAAVLQLKHLKESGLDVEKELQAAIELKKELYETDWDEDAKLFIDELPF